MQPDAVNATVTLSSKTAADRPARPSTVRDATVESVAEGRRSEQLRRANAAAEQAREAANRALAQKSRELAFEFDNELGRVIARLIDTETREVIRQVPSEELLAIARALADGQRAGALVRLDA